MHVAFPTRLLPSLLKEDCFKKKSFLENTLRGALKSVQVDAGENWDLGKSHSMIRHHA